ncbi:hypothetical protein [Streptomyces sp. SKN60]|uniref:hypothetical protein n=1 Tax=Streptomyces sp. SKN60 TaxID=2855506 RepID=UPI0022451AAD|nr:hypothetical protein [Streptomyces sp. SKN60]
MSLSAVDHVQLAPGPVQLHLGVEAAPGGGGESHCRAAKKGHPGLRVTGIADYAARDPVGNRLEFLEPLE